MQTIVDQSYEGERALYAQRDAIIENCTFGIGESALKETRNITAKNTKFLCKYIFWHAENINMEGCLQTVQCRAPIWYTKNVTVKNTRMENPKTFRECENVSLDHVTMTDGSEYIWHCKNLEIKNCKMENGIYAFMHCDNLTIDNFVMNGNYTFQYTNNVVIRNSELHAKDSFWHTDNVTIYDSIVDGEYIGWYSKNLRLVNCKISGTQPFCYAEDLVLENCTMEDNCDLAFEFTSVKADIKGNIHSIKNPLSGYINADSCGEIIIDEYCRNPGACKLNIGKENK